MRLMTEGWCERGKSLPEAAAALSMPVSTWWESDVFREAPSDDIRAAHNVWLLTGVAPERRDVKGAGDGLVDLVLRPIGAPPEPLEILATLDPNYQAALSRAAGLVAEFNGDEPPRLLFPVHMERGWQPPKTRGKEAREIGDRWRSLVEQVQREARIGPISTETAAAVQDVFPGIEFGAPIDGVDKSGFELNSWNAAVVDSDEVPYLKRLSNYLGTAERPLHHLEKLAREAVALGAQRRHLYLLVASTGRWGDLLPTSPSWFTDGNFTAPVGLTDLWLDGGTGYVMHWRREGGWNYHEER